MKKKLRINQRQLHSSLLCNKHKRSASKTAEGNASETTKEVQVKPQKEMQVKPQKEVQVKPQKEVQKEKPIQIENQLKNRLLSKTSCYRKAKPAEKENTKFSVNVLPQPPQPPIKAKKEYKISDVIKKEAN